MPCRWGQLVLKRFSGVTLSTPLHHGFEFCGHAHQEVVRATVNGTVAVGAPHGSYSEGRWDFRIGRSTGVGAPRRVVMTYLSQPPKDTNGRRLVKRESSLEAGRTSLESARPFRKTQKVSTNEKKEPGALTVFCLVIIFLSCMVLTIRCLPSMSTVERENEKFVWRPSTAAHFQKDKELLLRYREAHAWRLFVGMSLLYIM